MTKNLRKTLALGLLPLFFAFNALACGGGTEKASVAQASNTSETVCPVTGKVCPETGKACPGENLNARDREENQPKAVLAGFTAGAGEKLCGNRECNMPGVMGSAIISFALILGATAFTSRLKL